MEITEKLHQGSFSVIYKGYFEKRVYAIKVIPIPHLKYMECMIGKFQSSNLANIEDIKYIEQNAYILSELAISNLSDWVKENTVTIQNLWDWIKSILLALQELHLHNIIHGNVNATNILLYANNTVKLNDFSESKFSWLPIAPGISYDIRSLGNTISQLITERGSVDIESTQLQEFATECVTNLTRTGILLQKYFAIFTLPQSVTVPVATEYEPLDIETERLIRDAVPKGTEMYREYRIGVRTLLLRLPLRSRNIPLVVNIVRQLLCSGHSAMNEIEILQLLGYKLHFRI